MKNRILKASYILAWVAFFYCYFTDFQETKYIIAELISLFYLMIFTIVNKDKWIFRI